MRAFPPRPPLGLALTFCLLGLARNAAAEAPDRLTLRLGAGPTFVHGPSGFGGLGAIGLDVGFGRCFAFEFGGGLALRGGDVPHVALRVSTGLRVGTRTGPTRPYAGLRAAHVHDAPRDSYRAHPSQALTGDPRHGLDHLTLAGGAVGVEFGRSHGARRLRATFEVETLFVAHRSATEADASVAERAYTSAQLGLALRLR